MEMSTRHIRAHLAMVLFSLLVAGSHSVGGQIASIIEPTALMTLRFGIACILIGVLAVATQGFRMNMVHAPWRYLVLGALLVTFFVLMFVALKTSSPVSVAAIFTIIPGISAVFGFLILRQHCSPAMALALCVGTVGALWIIFRGSLDRLIALDLGSGEWIFLIGCGAYALFSPMARKLNRGEPTVYFMLGITFSGFLILAAISYRELMIIDWSFIPPELWWGLAYLTIGSTTITFLLFQYANMILNSANVMAYSFLTPGWVLLWEYCLVGTLPSVQTLLGVMIAASAMAVLFILDKRNVLSNGVHRKQ